MKQKLGVLFFLILMSAYSLASELLIENVTIITSDEGGEVSVSPHRWVQISDHTITAITSGRPEWPVNQPTVDGTGQFLIPGLMDSHVHTGKMPGMLWTDKSAIALQQQFYQQQPRSYLYYGVTQILDPASSPALLSRLTQVPTRPDIHFCGAVQILGGYGMRGMSIREAVKNRPYFIYRPEADVPGPEGFDPNAHTPEAVVNRMVSDGADCIKVFIEDGFNLNNDWPMVSEDTLSRLRNASDRAGLPLVAHANAVDMQTIALANQVDVLMHGMWNWLTHQGQDKLPDDIQKVADQIIQSKTFYQPTLNVMHSLKDVTVPGYLNNPELKNTVPETTINWYKSHSGQWFAREMLQGWGTTDLDRIHQRQEAVIQQGVRVMQYLYQQGHPMLLASDTPPAPTYASQPGLSALNELRRMHQAGIKLEDLFKAATLNNARAFNLDHRYGTVEFGKIANLLLLKSNPLKNVEAYNGIDKVILRGIVHERDSFKVR